MSIAVLNTDAGLSATTLLNGESAQNISGLKTFNRSPNPPFAVQAASATATNLDADSVDGAHYATGSWTPTDASGGALSFTNPTGKYVKIGTLVMIWGAVTYPGGGTGLNATIGGLPFTAIAFANAGFPGSVGFYNGSLDIYTYINPGTTNVLFYKSSGAAILNSDNNGRTIYFSGSYMT